MVNPGDIREAEIYGMPEPDLPGCIHCESPANPDLDVMCNRGFRQPHCDDCASLCEVCKGWYCGKMHKTEQNELVCKDCYKKLIEVLTIKISEPICEALGKLGYRFTDERHLDDWYLFEFISDELPTIVVRLSTKLKELNNDN